MTITQTQLERMFVGDLRAAERLAKENPVRIRTVVSVCTEKIQTRNNEVKCVHLPILDAQDFLP